MPKMKLSDESANSAGCIVMTDGIDLTRFVKNPIMLYNHNRAWQGLTSEMLPIGVWKNVEVVGKELWADAEFDMDDEFAAKIANKVEKGHLKGCSIGLRVLEMEPVGEGGNFYVIKRSELVEASICDIPANPNTSDVVLYDKDDKVLDLALLTTPHPLDDMLGLATGASEQERVDALQTLQDKLSSLSAENEELRARCLGYENEKTAERAQMAADMIRRAIEQGKINGTAADDFVKMFAEDFDRAERILSSLQARESLMSQVASTGRFDKSWDELDKEGLLSELKRSDPSLFEQKFNERFHKHKND